LLKVLGFVRRQVAAAVCWQAANRRPGRDRGRDPPARDRGRPGAVAGIRHEFGVVPVLWLPALLLAALAAGVLAGANVLAAGPALLAARSHPGQLLRAE